MAWQMERQPDGERYRQMMEQVKIITST